MRWEVVAWGALALLHEQGHDVHVIEYLKTPPDAATLAGVAAAVGGAKALPTEGQTLTEEAAKARGTAIHLLLEYLPARPAAGLIAHLPVDADVGRPHQRRAVEQAQHSEDAAVGHERWIEEGAIARHAVAHGAQVVAAARDEGAAERQRREARVHRRLQVLLALLRLRADVGRRRELALGEAVDAVVLADVRHVHTTPDQVRALTRRPQRERAHRVERRAGADVEGVAGGGGWYMSRSAPESCIKTRGIRLAPVRLR